MSLFPLAGASRRSTSPAWSVYDEYWGGDVHHAPCDEVDASMQSPDAPLHGIPFISYPPYPTTLRGGALKKKAPIRRGAQGAVYAAYDTSHVQQEAETTERHVEVHVDDDAHFDTRGLPTASGGTLVAVKRIFLQSNDFGARDISATVLREITLHRLVSDEQDRCLSQSGANAAVFEAEEEIQQWQLTEKCLLDDSARVLRLLRVVEAPHKEMCLVMELAATSLERLLAPRAGLRGGPGAANQRRKPGMVTLFGGGNTGVPFSSGSAGGRADAFGALAESESSSSTSRCPLLSQLPLVRYVMRRLLRLVCFLHEDCRVVHRDLKPSNVLVTEGGGLRLGDFGSARFLPPPALSSAGVPVSAVPMAKQIPSSRSECLACTPPSMRTTLHYRPPEVLLGDQACRPAADVWALGVMFAQLVLQKNLFRSESELDLLGAIQKLLGMPARTPAWIATEKPEAEQGEASAAATAIPSPPFTVATTVQASLPFKLHAGVVTADGLDLVTRMLCQLPEHRLSVRGAMQHPFLNPGGIGSSLCAADDAAGAALWKQKVEEVMRGEAAKKSEEAGPRPFAGLGLGRPTLLGLRDADDDGEEDDEDSDDGVAPFRLDLGGGYQSS